MRYDFFSGNGKKGGFFLILMFVLLISVGPGCVNPQMTNQGAAKESSLTSGMTKEYIQRGKTTQTDVLEIFGPPDLITHKAGKDVWTYDKMLREVSVMQGGILAVGIGGSFGGVGGVSGGSSYESTKSVMLIIYYDSNDVVMDYKLSVAKF